MEGHGAIMRKHHILTAVAAAAVFSLGASTLALAGEESTSGGTFTYARSDSTTSFDLFIRKLQKIMPLQLIRCLSHL